MMKRITLLTAALLLLSDTGFSATTPGAQLFYLGMGARQFSLAGSAVAAFTGSTEDIYFNPAALAYNEQLRIGLNWGAQGTPYQYAGLGASWLIDRGVLTLSGAYSGYTGTNTPSTGKGFFLRGAFSKRITPTFLFGFGLAASGALPEPEGILRPGIAADIGLILLGSNPTLQKPRAPGFVLEDFSFGFSLLNLGLNPDTEAGRPFPDPVAKTGFGFTFLQTAILDLHFQTDLTLALNDWNLRYGGGLDVGLFGFLHLRAGLHFGNPDLGPLTLGASLKPDALMGDNPLEISWSYIPVRFHGGQKEHAHFFSLNFTLGGLDRTPPEVKFVSQYTAFSPNGDGVQDTVPFALDIRDNRILKGWHITLHDSRGNLVRTLSNDNTGSGIHSLGDFFRKLFAREGSIDSPSAWIWDGKDAKGKLVPEGPYTYQAKAVDAKLNRGISLKGTILVDNTPPDAAVSVTPRLFSPNRDGRLDRTILSNKTTRPEKLWIGEITDKNGKTLKSWNWPLKPPGQLPWDGKDKNGKIVQDGEYRYRLTGIDPAGNKVRKESRIITVSTKNRSLDTSASPQAFSPNGDNYLDTIRFNHKQPDARWFQSWEFSIKNSSGQIVHQLKGTNHPAPPFVWSGKNRYGKPFPDGMYQYILKATYLDGDHPTSSVKKFLIDNTPPEAQLRVSPKLFSPDKDGYNDTIRLDISLEDRSPIKNWTVIIRKGTNTFKSFSGTGESGKKFSLTWDGIGDDKKSTVESATFYSAELTATDALGNTGKSPTQQIEVDILIIKTARGLKIRISNIEFELNKWNLKKKRSPILDRVAEVLKRYGKYKIIIEGHTDKTGNFNYNLMLSTRRARTVMRYLIRRGIDEDRMLAKGLGPTVPIANNWSAAGRAKNRRVEFILVKED